MMGDERLTEGSICDINVVYERVRRNAHYGVKYIKNI